MLSLDMAKKDDWADYRKSRLSKKAFLKNAIIALHRRKSLAQNPVLRNRGDTEALSIRGVAMSGTSGTQWHPSEVAIHEEWVWELEKLGLATITPTPHLPDTQSKNYYVATLTPYDIEKAFQIIENS